MLPTPTRDAAETVKAWKELMDCALPEASGGVLLPSVLIIAGSSRICATPVRTVK